MPRATPLQGFINPESIAWPRSHLLSIEITSAAPGWSLINEHTSKPCMMLLKYFKQCKWVIIYKLNKRDRKSCLSQRDSWNTLDFRFTVYLSKFFVLLCWIILDMYALVLLWNTFSECPLHWTVRESIIRIFSIIVCSFRSFLVLCWLQGLHHSLPGCTVCGLSVWEDEGILEQRGGQGKHPEQSLMSIVQLFFSGRFPPTAAQLGPAPLSSLSYASLIGALTNRTHTYKCLQMH